MKKKIIIIVAAVVILAIAAVALLLLMPKAENLSTEGLTGGKATYIYGNTNEYRELKDADIEKLKSLFDGKELYGEETPACGFSEDVSVTLGDRVFCIARDGCGIVMDKASGKYFDLSESEASELHSILGTYGLKFPCI